MSVWPDTVTIQMSFMTCCRAGCAVTFGMPAHMKQEHPRYR